MAVLFDKEFIHALTLLRIRARQVPRGGRFGEHRSHDTGGGIEFRDFRAYTPGPTTD